MENGKSTLHYLLKYVALSTLVFCVVVLLTPSTPLPILNKTNQPYTATSSSTWPNFTDQTLLKGLIFQHLQGDKQLTGLNETLGAGACVIDYNNDGWMDLFLVNGSGQTRYYQKQYWWQQSTGHNLYLNLGNGNFKNVSKQSGFEKTSWGMGCLAADFNNDNHTDLLITNMGENVLYKNTGQGAFVDVTTRSGITGKHWSTSATAADYDGDGLLDIYIANYIDFRKGAKTYERQSQYEEEIPASFNAKLYDAVPNQLLKNRGNFKFEDVTHKAGVEDKDGRSLDASWLNANDDNYPDLFITNDEGGGSNTLYINQGDGTFAENTIAMNLSTALGYHALSFGDLDNDGDNDLVVTSKHTQSNLLLINKTDPHLKFNDRAKILNLTKERFSGFSGWGANIQDFNNDGWQDIFISNGYTIPDPDSDKIPLGQGQRLWLNQGDDGFKEISWEAGIPLQDMQSSRGSVTADFDNDGDMDIYTVNNNDLGQLLINNLESDNHWIGIKLIGSISNRGAIGAKVTLHHGELTQSKDVSAGNSFLSSNDPRIHFGLGNSDLPVSITIKWPNGKISNHSHLALNRYTAINQEKGIIKGITSTNSYQEIPTTSLSLALDRENPESRRKYIAWLSKNDQNEIIRSQIVAALKDSDPSVRLTATNILGNQKSDISLRILINALNDPNSEVRTAAVLAIRDYESESSVRWLLRMFKDPSSEVRKQTAMAFGFFYREEEAVIYRKYLAIPHLIRLLDDEDIDAKIAAIRALGDAENYRAISPLADLLSDNSYLIRSEAARSLGLIREQGVTNKLLESLSTDPKVNADILIALKRLAYPHVIEKLKTLLDENSIGLKTISEILKNKQDGIVFSQKELTNLIEEWFLNQKYYSNDINISLITISSHLGDQLSKKIKRYLVRIKSPALRGKAYKSLLKSNNSVDRQRIAESGLKDSSLLVRNAILESAEELNIKLSHSVLIENINIKETSLSAINASINNLNSKIVERLLSIAHKNTYSIDVRSTALFVASQFGRKLPNIDISLLNSSDNRLREAALRYWGKLNHTITKKPQRTLQHLSESLISPDPLIQQAAIDVLISLNEKWARNSIANLLIGQNNSITLRKQIIQTIGELKSSVNLSMLMKVANNRDDLLRLEAITALSYYPSSTIIDRYMWQLLADSNEDANIRMIAAEKLIENHNSKVLEILQQDSVENHNTVRL